MKGEQRHESFREARREATIFHRVRVRRAQGIRGLEVLVLKRSA
jgi:hypothetical protein